MNAEIGIIGGSGLYDMAELTGRQEVSLTTPFGDPSGHYVLGTLRGRKVAFLARHGAGHRISPSELNFRANIFGMKKLGVQAILSASAVGSLKEELKPLDIVVPDQFIDRTRGRISTFFGRGIVVHVGFAHPICGTLAKVAGDAGEKVGATVHRGGTYVCMEGPQFSTLAESRLYRSWGADIIGMTNLLRLLAPRPRRGNRGHGDRDAAPEREDRTAAHRGSRAAGATDPHLRLRHRAQVRHHHAPGGDSGGREEGTGTDYWQIHVSAKCEVQSAKWSEV
jgi:5'-deoxy-5'-methylthioadenosine phosphorylase